MLHIYFSVVFTQIAFTIGVLTSSLRVGDHEVSGLVAGGVSARVSLVVPDRGCDWEVLGRGVVESVVWDVSGGD